MKLRISVGCLMMGALIFALSSACLSAQIVDVQWSQFQGDAQHTGVSQFNGPQSEVYAKWTFPASAGEGSPSLGSDGTIYITDRLSQSLVAVNPDGTEKWRVYLGTVTRGAPAIDAEGRIYVGGEKGDLFAIDPPGVIQWTYATPNSRSFGDAGIFGSPTIGEDGTVYVAGLDGYLFALDRQGNVKWQNNVFRNNNYYNWFWGAAPAIGKNGNIYIQSVDRMNLRGGQLFAFDGQTGELKWSFFTGAALWQTPTVGSDGTVYAGGSASAEDGGSNFYALKDLGNEPVVLWSIPTGGAAWQSSAAFSPDGQYVYLKSLLPRPNYNANTKFIVKLDVKTGEEIWEYPIYAHIYSNSPIVGGNGTIYIGTGNGYKDNAVVIAISSDGDYLWSFQADELIWNTAAIGANGTLYVGSDKLYALTEINPSNSAPAVTTYDGVFEVNTEVPLLGTVSDKDGDSLYYEWTAGTVVICSGAVDTVVGGTSVDVPVCIVDGLGIGRHEFDLTVDDGSNPPVSSRMNAEVVDTTPPLVSASIANDVLWPPNNKMVAVSIDTNTSDNSGLPVALSAVVSSNEPEGSDSDWSSAVVDPATGVINLGLRAQRSGEGGGRTYTIKITAVDSSGNSSTTAVEVFVPHDNRN